jgi:hypothetical protein
MEKRRRYNLFYGIKLAFVLLMQKGKLETDVRNFLISITWVLHYYTLLLSINWWKKWIDFVKTKLYSNEILNNITCNLNWIEFKFSNVIKI